MSIVLWPRQEVLQLVVPQLANAGTPLSNASVELAIKTLQSLQTKDNKIRYLMRFVFIYTLIFK